MTELTIALHLDCASDDERHLYQSGAVLSKVLPGNIMLNLLFAFFVYMLSEPQTVGDLMLLIACVVMLALCLRGFVRFVTGEADRYPRVTLSRDGIRDHGWGGSFVRWTDIREIRHAMLNGDRSIAFELRDPARFEDNSSFSKRLLLKFGKSMGLPLVSIESFGWTDTAFNRLLSLSILYHQRYSLGHQN